MIFGAGQYGQIVYETAEAMECFGRIDFLDDHNPMAVGCLNDYLKLREQYECVFVAIGDPCIRLKWLEKAEKAGYDLVTLIHPKAYVSKTATLAKGCIVEPMAVIQAGAVVETGGLLCAGCVVNHNSVLKQGCQIDCNAVVPARGVVPEMTKIPCGTVAEIFDEVE